MAHRRDPQAEAQPAGVPACQRPHRRLLLSLKLPKGRNKGVPPPKGFRNAAQHTMAGTTRLKRWPLPKMRDHELDDSFLSKLQHGVAAGRDAAGAVLLPQHHLPRAARLLPKDRHGPQEHWAATAAAGPRSLQVSALTWLSTLHFQISKTGSSGQEGAARWRVASGPLVCRFGSWMGGDRDGNPFVTPETTRDVVITARLSAVNLFFQAIEQLMFSLSNWRCSDEMRVSRAGSRLWCHLCGTRGLRFCSL